MRILICGGTGFLGRHIVNALMQQGHDPVVRSRHSDPALDFAKMDSAQDWLPHLQNVDAVINAVDKGALDCTIRARVAAACQRAHLLARGLIFHHDKAPGLGIFPGWCLAGCFMNFFVMMFV